MILSAGCKTVYLEKETPPGQVPPLPASSSKSEQSSVPVFSSVSTKTIESSNSNSSKESVQPADSSGSIINQFQNVYSAKKSPRIAIFLNRELSDEVQEWNTPSRLVVSGKMKYSREGISGESGNLSIDNQGTQSGSRVEGGKVKAEGESGAFYEQAHNDLEERGLPPENWIWQFEDSFLRKFLEAKAFIVDRATIMRLAAAKNSKQDDPHNLVSVKNIEIDALKEKADIFMEVLVHKNPDSPVGYEFRVAVKEVSTGRLLANVSSLEWKQKELDKLFEKKFKATEHGYVKIEEGGFPELDKVANLLALDVMKALTATWTP